MKKNSLFFKHKVVRIIFVFLILFGTFGFNAFAQNHPLDHQSASALVEKLKGELASVIKDEAEVESITKKWELRNLAGQTKIQIIEALFEDVKSIVVDAAQLKAISDLWNAPVEGEEAPTSHPTATMPTPEPTPEATPHPTPEPTPEPTPHPTPEPTPEPQTTPEIKVAPRDAQTSALVETLIGDLVSVIDDESQVGSIVKTWESKDLTGKTKDQALEILFEDVKSNVSDAGQQKAIWELWNAPAETEKPEATPEPIPEPTPVPTPEATPEPQPTPLPQITPYIEPTPVPIPQKPIEVLPEPPSTEGLIEIGEAPLSEADMNKVMNWIAVKVSTEKLPFCWKQTFGRGAGVPLSSDCAAGLQKSGLLCYPQCKDGFNGAGPVCWGNCPGGFTDIGAFCQKPPAYGRGVGYPWKFGDAFNLNAATNRCENERGKNNCEKHGAIIYPKCKAGFHAVGCCFCSPDCPPGYNNTGTGCTKPSYGRGAGVTLSCPAGTERSGLLCYPACKQSFDGVGPVCWQSCPSQTPFNCGAACATNQNECATAVMSMVQEPVMLVVNTATLIATLGQSAAATGAAKAGQVATTVTKLAASMNKVKNAFKAVKGSVEQLVGGPAKLAQIKKIVKIGKKTYKVASTIGSEIDNFSIEFANNFSDMTSPEIDAEINARFGKVAAYQIKKEWGARHLMMNLEANGFATAKFLLELVSIADPIGVTGVINAFLHPICKSDAKLPEVTPLYDY